MNNSDPSGMMSCNLSRAVIPWNPALVALGRGSYPSFCAGVMGVNWVWNNTLGPLINLYTISNQSQATMLAKQIVNSTQSAMIAMWMDSYSYSGCTPNAGGSGIQCSTPFSTWMSSDPFTTEDLGGTHPWTTWIGDIVNAQVLGVLVLTAIQAIANYPAGNMGGQVASYLESQAGFNPVFTVPTAPGSTATTNPVNGSTASYSFQPTQSPNSATSCVV